MLDAAEGVHICYSYTNYTHEFLRYAWKVGASWMIEDVIAGTIAVGKSCSMELDSSGAAHISHYYGAPANSLLYSTNASGSWELTTVDANVGTVNPDMATALVLDNAGFAHVAYTDASLSDVNYATNASGTWILDSVETGTLVGSHCSLALDVNGYAHISYAADTTLDLKYANNLGGSWDTAVVDASNSNPEHSSIALDSNGQPIISYQDSARGCLKCAIGP